MCLKFLTLLRLGFSHLKEHKFRRNCQGCPYPLCCCGLEIDDTSHYLLHCHQFSHHSVYLMNSVKSVCDSFESMSGNVKKDAHLFDMIKSKIKLFWKQLSVI